MTKTLLLLCALAVFSFGKQLHLLTEHNPPWNYKKEGKITGIATQAVKAIAKEAGDSYTLKILPWNRAYNMALQKAAHGVFLTLKTQQREDKFHWIGPLYQEKFYLYENKNAPTGVTTLQEAKDVSIIDAGPKQNALHQILQKKGFTNLSFLSKDIADVTALAQQKVSLIALGQTSIKAHCELTGTDCELFRKLPVVISQKAFYLAFSKKTDSAVIQRWQKAYEQLQAQNVFQKLWMRFEKEGL